MTSIPAAGQRQFPCSKCGATLFWDPGSKTLKCPYCGTENTVADVDTALADVDALREQDFIAQLLRLAGAAETVEATLVRCEGCGAEQTLSQGQTAGRCVFCGSAIVTQASVRRLIKPRAVLPFKISQKEAIQAFTGWLSSLWFAPGNLKLFAERDGLNGVYVPAWTYDTNTETPYAGQRGDDYWETESYTAYENNQPVQKTRQVRKTNWSWVSGRVVNSFDDVLVFAVRTLPPKADRLEPWDLASLSPYDDRYLSGFTAQAYTVDLPSGFEIAKQKIRGTIEQTICRDIGGDHQRIDSANPSYHDITFKHILLPVWISAYRYQGKLFTFLVNARTGVVQGDRPYSIWKIIGLICIVLVVLLILFLLFQRR